MKPKKQLRMTIPCLLFIALFSAGPCAHSQPTNGTVKIRQAPEPNELSQKVTQDLLKRARTERDAEYTRVFSELGLKPEDQQRFKSRLNDLLSKAMAAGDAMTVLLGARVDYDKEIHACLGDAKYQRYRQYEDSKPARRECELLRDFAARSNSLAMDPAFSDKMIGLIRKTKATTTESWAGPYGPRPQPEVGLAMCFAAASRRAAELRQASSNLVELLPKSGLPQAEQQLLMDYYSHKIAEAEATITRFSVPEAEFYRRILMEAEKERQELMLRNSLNSMNLMF
jgi:hypothetical protein